MSAKSAAVVFGTLTVIAMSEKEYTGLQRSFAAKGLLFTSNLGTENDGKSPEEVKLEAEHASLSGLKRFRLSKDQKAQVDAGEKTRVDFLKEEVAALKKEQVKAAKSVKVAKKQQKECESDNEGDLEI